MKDKIVSILENDILWYVESKSVKELDETSEEYIKKCIQDGISSGELNVSYGRNNNLTASGWWQIINWRDIACELFNANTPEKMEAAKKRFNDNWKF